MRAILLPEGSIVLDLKEATKLYAEFFGMPLGMKKYPHGRKLNRPLILDKYETLFLAERGLEVYHRGKRLPLEELREMLLKSEREEILSNIYNEIRSKGYIPRPGAKFGADFLIYEKGPGREHAPYALVYLEKLSGRDIIRVSRLSHAVRKYSIVALGKRKRYYIIRWFKELK